MPAKGQRRKQQIIDTAKEMFIKNGFQSTHIGQVCTKLNIARGTVYQYFGNKKEILYAILENVEEEIDDIFDIDDLIDYLEKEEPKASITDFLLQRFTSCIKALVAEPIVIKLVFKDIIGIDEDVIERVSQFISHITGVIKRDVETLKSRKLYREDIDQEISSIMIIGSLLLLVGEYEKKGKDILDPETVASVVNISLNGIIVS